jgi:hypothetical protein
MTDTDQPGPTQLDELINALTTNTEEATHASIAHSENKHELRVTAATHWTIDDTPLHPHGPAAAALASGHIARTDTTLACTRFPAYTRQCAAMTIRSVAAFPIHEHHRRTIGDLTVTSPDYHPFTVSDLRTAQHLAARSRDPLPARL